ncbi:MAG TPA: ribosome biogenesis GTP-binding protein YihA/YsxC [Candidatus Paceibacterota bacterium]|nr:ribosome biogenesis GTP-binding protein YihA/YsxC [Candidatus Paceibacterota bacterium]
MKTPPKQDKPHVPYHLRNYGKVGPSGSMKQGDGREGVRVRFTRGIHGTDDILSMPYPQIAFVGRSNVGKSSIINALLGGVFARVSATPGKTQEINFYTVDDRLFVVDLPGYGYAKLPIPIAEKIRKHILWYLGSDEVRPKVVLLILDARVGVTDADRELIKVVEAEKHPLLVVLNKWDKLNQSEAVHAMRNFKAEFPHLEVMPVSAEKKYNVPALFERLELKK